MDEKQIEGLRKLAESSVSESGEVLSFEEQMTAYEAHALPSGEFFVVAAHADELGIPTADSKPLLMRQGIITKSFRDHSIPPKDIENLPEWIKTHVIAFESAERDDSVCCIASATDAKGDPIMVAVNMKSKKQGLEIEEITSIHGRTHLGETLRKAIEMNKEIFVNTRTSDWLLHTGVQFPEQTAARLWSEISTFCDRMQQKAAGNPNEQQAVAEQAPAHTKTDAVVEAATPAQPENIATESFYDIAAEEGEHFWYAPEEEELVVVSTSVGLGGKPSRIRLGAWNISPIEVFDSVQGKMTFDQIVAALPRKPFEAAEYSSADQALRSMEKLAACEKLVRESGAELFYSAFDVRGKAFESFVYNIGDERALFWSPSHEIAVAVLGGEGSVAVTGVNNVDAAVLAETLESSRDFKDAEEALLAVRGTDSWVSSEYQPDTPADGQRSQVLEAVGDTMTHVTDWQHLPEADIDAWRERVEGDIDLSRPIEPTENATPERTGRHAASVAPASEKLKRENLSKKIPGLFKHKRSTARQDESRAQSQARGDDGKRPTRAAEKDL